MSPVSGQISRSARYLPGPGRRWVTNTGPWVRPRISLGSSRAVPASQYTVSRTCSWWAAPRRRVRGFAPLDFTRAHRRARSRTSMSSWSSSSVRAQVSCSIRHSAFSRRWISRREMSRSLAVRERTGVSESGGVERAADAGTCGASQPCSRHQDSHFATAAWRAFQVLNAAWPQRVSRAAPISSWETELRARLGPGHRRRRPSPVMDLIGASWCKSLRRLADAPELVHRCGGYRGCFRDGGEAQSIVMTTLPWALPCSTNARASRVRSNGKVRSRTG